MPAIPTHHSPTSTTSATRCSAPGVKYQVTVFGTAGHGFTDPDAARLQLDGVSYDELANDLSWNGTLVLLQHVFEH